MALPIRTFNPIRCAKVKDQMPSGVHWMKAASTTSSAWLIRSCARTTRHLPTSNWMTGKVFVAKRAETRSIPTEPAVAVSVKPNGVLIAVSAAIHVPTDTAPNVSLAAKPATTTVVTTA